MRHIRATPPADMSEEGIGRLEETMQEHISLAALRGVKRIYVFGEMILYQTTLFAKSGAIRQLRKRGIPAHPMKHEVHQCRLNRRGIGAPGSHFDYQDKTRATRIVKAALFHEIPGGFQSIEHDHGASEDFEVYDVACFALSDTPM